MLLRLNKNADAFLLLGFRVFALALRAPGGKHELLEILTAFLSESPYMPPIRIAASLLPFLPAAKKETLVGSSGLEPPTSRLSGVRSNQLSYEPK